MTDMGGDTNVGKSGGGAAGSGLILARIVAVIVGFFVPGENDLAFLSEAGFFSRLLAAIVGTVLGTFGGIIGDVLRKIAAPSMTFVSGKNQSEIFFKQLGVKFFWWVGPQLMGVTIGAAGGAVLILKALS